MSVVTRLLKEAFSRRPAKTYRRNRLGLESLEVRECPTTVTWNGPSGTYGDSYNASNWVGGVRPTSNDIIAFNNSSKWIDFTSWPGDPQFAGISDTTGTKIMMDELKFTNGGTMYGTDFEIVTVNGHLTFDGGHFEISGSAGMPPMVPANPWKVTDTDGSLGATSWWVIKPNASVDFGTSTICQVMIQNLGTMNIESVGTLSFRMEFPATGYISQVNKWYNHGLISIKNADIRSDAFDNHNIVNEDSASLGRGRIEKLGSGFSHQWLGIENKGGEVLLKAGTWNISGYVYNTDYAINSTSPGTNYGTIEQNSGTSLEIASGKNILVRAGYYRIKGDGAGLSSLTFWENSNYLRLVGQHIRGAG